MAFQQLGGESVLVTGANGFIGSHITRKLVSLGAKVSLVIRPNGQCDNLNNIIHALTVLEIDLNNQNGLCRAVKKLKPDRVIHLAAVTDNRRGIIGTQALEVNVLGTLNLLNALKSTAVKSIVCTGTAEEYGIGDAPFKESQQVLPVSAYSASKAAMSTWCQMLYRSSQIPVTVVRPFLVYGPGQSARFLIPQVIMHALANKDIAVTAGEQLREFTFIDDLVDGFLLALLAPKALGEIINLGTGQAVQVKTVVEKIYAMIVTTGKPLIGKLQYRDQEIWNFYSDNSKAKRLLGWEAKTDLQSGLQHTIAWYSAQKQA